MEKKLRAVAIEYAKKEVPTVSAMGTGELARKILDVARAAGVPVRKDEDLVALLSILELNQEVPRYLYDLVAEVLAYSYWLRDMKPENGKGED